MALRTHTTDTLLAGDGVVSSTTDTLLIGQFTQSHTTDSLLQAGQEETHTTDSLLSGGGLLNHTTDALIYQSINVTQTTDSLLIGPPVGFGDQVNNNFSTSSSTFVTGYTINPTQFESGKDYMVFISYTQRSTSSDEDVATRIRFNGATIPRSEFTNSSPVSTRSNGYWMGQITQGAIPTPITIEIAYQGGGSQSAILDHVRWFAIELDSLNPNDYFFAESNTPVDITTSMTTVTLLNLNANNEDWAIFYCMNAEDTIGAPLLIKPTSPGGFGVLTRYNFDNSFITAGPSHKFESVFDNKSQSFIQHITGATAGSGLRTVRLQANKTNVIPNTLACTGSIFAVKMSALNGVHNQAGAPTSLINRTIGGTQTAWNVGWNSNDAEIISNGAQLGDSGVEEKISTTLPINMDYRSDVYSAGSYNFEYNGIATDDKRHFVFLFDAPPISFASHTTDAILTFFGSLNHSTDSMIFQAFALHTTDTFLLAPTVIRGSGNIALGEIKGEGSGVLSKFAEDIDPACINRRILSKYGWTPTKTRTTGFKSCQIKR